MPEGRLKCGHPVGWILRLRDTKGTHRYCWGCAIEKIGLKEIDQPDDLVAVEVTFEKKKKKDDSKIN